MTKYIEVKRKAKEGERIRIVDAFNSYNKYKNGDEYIVDDVDSEGVDVEAVSYPEGNRYGHIYHREYVVLEPVADDAESPSPKTDRDLIVELSQTVAKLKREAELNDDFIAELLTRYDERIERLTDDVCMLDDRTQPLVEDGISDFAKELAEMIECKINESRAEGRI